MMDANGWKNYRKVWTKARDDNKISKGAVSGVSIGDLIDGVAKAYAKGLNPLRAALAKLLPAIKKYKAGIAAKKSKLTAWIEANLEKEANELDKGCVDTLAAFAVAAAVEKAEDKMLACPKNTHYQEKHLEATKKNLNWLDLVKTDLATVGAAAQEFQTANQALKLAQAKLKVEIPVGQTKPSDTFEWAVGATENYSNIFKLLSKAKSNSEYQGIMVAKGPELPHAMGPKEASEVIRRREKEQAG